jgi:peptide/nickel transport system substrate-binding protein
MLAKSWYFAKDGSYLQMSLRSGVKFHDGTPFNAAAVKTNIDHELTAPGVTTSAALVSVASVSVINTYTVRFYLKPGQGADLPSELASSAGAMISPAALASGRNLSTNPGNSGSGPYILTKVEPGAQYTYQHAPGKYWDASAGDLQKIVFNISADAATRLTALQTGQANLVLLQSPQSVQAESLAKQGQINVYNVPGYLIVDSLFINSASNPELSKQGVRQAIAYAINKNAIDKGVFDNTCPPADQPFPPPFWASDPSLTGYSYNPAKARALLAAAGATHLSLTIGAASGTPFEQEAIAIQQELENIGIHVSIAAAATFPESQSDFLSGQDQLFMGFLGTNTEPALTVDQYLVGGYNLVKNAAQRAQIQQLVDSAANPTLTLAQQAQKYTTIWQELSAEAWAVPTCTDLEQYAYAKDVTGVPQMPLLKTGLFDIRTLGIAKP